MFEALYVIMKILLLVIAVIVLGGIAYIGYFFFNGDSLPLASEIKSFHIVYSDGDDIGESDYEISDLSKISELRNIIGDLQVPRLPIPSKEIPDEPHEQWMINIYFKNGDQRYIPVFKDEPNNKIYEYLKEKYK